MPSLASFKVVTLTLPGFTENLSTLLHSPCSRVRSQEFIGHIAQWVRRGLIIKYLPAYAPELNLIEILWRFMKDYWLPFSVYASFSCLYEAIEQILTRVGTEYTIAFQAA